MLPLIPKGNSAKRTGHPRTPFFLHGRNTWPSEISLMLGFCSDNVTRRQPADSYAHFSHALFFVYLQQMRVRTTSIPCPQKRSAKPWRRPFPVRFHGNQPGSHSLSDYSCRDCCTAVALGLTPAHLLGRMNEGVAFTSWWSLVLSHHKSSRRFNKGNILECSVKDQSVGKNK